jgi:hypothetical protein
MKQEFGLLPGWIGLAQHGLQMIDVINQHPMMLIHRVGTGCELFSPNYHMKIRVRLFCENGCERHRQIRPTEVCPQEILFMIQFPPGRCPDYSFFGKHPPSIASDVDPLFFNAGWKCFRPARNGQSRASSKPGACGLVRLRNAQLWRAGCTGGACCTTANNPAGTGFHAPVNRPLPFVMRRIEPDRFYIFQYK